MLVSTSYGADRRSRRFSRRTPGSRDILERSWHHERLHSYGGADNGPRFPAVWAFFRGYDGNGYGRDGARRGSIRRKGLFMNKISTPVSGEDRRRRIEARIVVEPPVWSGAEQVGTLQERLAYHQTPGLSVAV